MECVENKFLRLPNIPKYEADRRTEEGFVASVEMDDGFEFKLYARFIQQAFPSTVMQLIEKEKMMWESAFWYLHIYRTGQLRSVKKMEAGILTMPGTACLWGHSIYLCERENKNPQPKQYKAVSIFERSSVVSSLILRELFADTDKVWKLKHLAERVGCSIGQVSKVMGFLTKNGWAEKTAEGYVISEPALVLKEWGRV